MKKYICTLTQTGTGAPVATVAEDTLTKYPAYSNMQWVRDGEGRYAFKDPAEQQTFPPGTTIFSPNFGNGPWEGAGTVHVMQDDNLTRNLYTKQDGQLTDGLLYNHPVMILVP